MIRFFFRLLATLTLAMAVVLAVLDATRSIAASTLVTTSLLSSWTATSPGTLSALQQSVTDWFPFAWDPVLVAALRLPGFAVMALVALFFYVIGRRPSVRADRFVTEI